MREDVRFGPGSPSGLVTGQAALTSAPGSVFECTDGLGLDIAAGASIDHICDGG